MKRKILYLLSINSSHSLPNFTIKIYEVFVATEEYILWIDSRRVNMAQLKGKFPQKTILTPIEIVNFDILIKRTFVIAPLCELRPPQKPLIMVRTEWDHTELPATHTFYTRKGRATPVNLHQQSLSSTAVTHCLLVATHFTNPERMVACVNLQSAASGSWTRATGVRGECVITRPSVPVKEHESNTLLPAYPNNQC